MKVALIPEKCIACGLCQTYSNIFDYQDDGIVKFSDTDNLEKEVPNSDQVTVLAVKSCPTKALTIL
ncbi:TPA: ferredoxin [Streptococcus agalactiae]